MPLKNSNTFEELNGEVVQNVAFTISNHLPIYAGCYYRLTDASSCLDKQKLFLQHKDSYYKKQQIQFLSIPGVPIGYWVSSQLIQLFQEERVGNQVISKAGVVTGDDKYFVRNWFEVSYPDICFIPNDASIYYKYHPFCKGGSSRKYYGNYEYVIKLKDLWDDHLCNKSVRRGDREAYFRKIGNR